jgi:hypothetical protein
MKETAVSWLIKELDNYKKGTSEYLSEFAIYNHARRMEDKQETFIKTDNFDRQWLSPVATERDWQEEKLVEIFGHYPNASPKWQYMNGLIQNSLDAKQMYSKEEVIKAHALGMDYYAEPNDWDKVTPKQKLENLLNKEQ